MKIRVSPESPKAGSTAAHHQRLDIAMYAVATSTRCRDRRAWVDTGPQACHDFPRWTSLLVRMRLKAMVPSLWRHARGSSHRCEIPRSPNFASARAPATAPIVSYPCGEARGIGACGFPRGVTASSPLAGRLADTRIRPRRRGSAFRRRSGASSRAAARRGAAPGGTRCGRARRPTKPVGRRRSASPSRSGC